MLNAFVLLARECGSSGCRYFYLFLLRVTLSVAGPFSALFIVLKPPVVLFSGALTLTF
jgi:hypothetical protein